ncbi:MAG: ABC transporter substrate-binding protein [Chloroflexota bacterium]|nr:ABC transporter substrate-binding protein [Chloroflexota bacterium]
MSGKRTGGKVSRRDFLRLTGLATAGTIVAACGAPAPGTPAAGTTPEAVATTAAGAATTAPEATAAAEVATEATAATAEATATAAEAAAGATDEATPTRVVPRGQAAQVPRERSFILMFTAGEVGVGNPYAAGYTHQRGHAALMEPLYFYSAFAQEPNIPWLAESHEYAQDFKEVTIKIRNGVEWSDGTPFTARDVAFTINLLRQNEKLAYGADMKKWVQDATAADETTVRITFTQPAPRFVYDFLSSKFDTGIYLLPEHIFKDVTDVTTFLFYDPAKGWPVHTGPYKIVDWTPQQEMMDLRQDWWAAKTGFAPLPEVERIVTVPLSDDTGMAQAAINNELDSTFTLPPPLIKTVVDRNPKIITHSGREKPYGYVDWWPQSLWINCDAAPYNDVEVRRALNHAINRDQIIEIGQEGAGKITELPFPEFPSLTKYFEAAKPVLQQHPVNQYDPTKTEEIMTRKGYTRDGEGLWVGQDGNRIDATIWGFPFMADYGAVLAEQIRNGGFDSSFQAPPDSYTKMDEGSGKLFLFGHWAAIADVFPTLDLLHMKHYRPTGETGGITTRWKNEEYSKIMDEWSQFPVGDDRAMPLYLKAIEIYLRELPDIPIMQFYHRIAYNTTYWTNWPTAENPYVNGAFWHQTFPLVLHKLKRVT